MSFRLSRAALAAALFAATGTCGAVDLLQSYDSALRSDPTLAAATEAQAAGREKSIQADTLFKPQVALAGSLTRVDDHTSTTLPAPLTEVIKPQGAGTVHQVSLQLIRPLYNAKSAADGRQLRQQTELSTIGLRDAQQDLIRRVGEAYFAVLLAEETLQVVRAQKAAVTLQRDRAQARFDVGRGRVTDLQEAQARLDSVAAKEVSAAGALTLRRATYQELTGRDADGLAPLAAGFAPDSPQPDSVLAWQARAHRDSPRIQAKEAELAIATEEIAKYRLAARPTLDLVASYTDKGQHGGLSPVIAPDSSRIATIGLQFNVPLYTAGAYDSKLRESLAKQRQAEQTLAAARRDARLQTQDAFEAVTTGIARVTSLAQSVGSAGTALAATTLGRDLGTRTELDVLEAQQRLYTAQLDLAQARHDYLSGRLRLAAAAGSLGEDELRTLNAYLAR